MNEIQKAYTELKTTAYSTRGLRDGDVAVSFEKLIALQIAIRGE